MNRGAEMDWLYAIGWIVGFAVAVFVLGMLSRIIWLICKAGGDAVTQL